MALNQSIKDVDDFNSEASEVFERFLKGFTIENKLIKEAEDGDMAAEEWAFVYTTKGQRLAEKMKLKLIQLGQKHFPSEENDIEIESYLYQEY